MLTVTQLHRYSEIMKIPMIVFCCKIVKYSVVTSGIDIDKEMLSKIGGWSLMSVTTILM